MKIFDPVTGLAKDTFGFGTYEAKGRQFPGLVRFGGDIIDLSETFRDTHEIMDDWDRNFARLVEINARPNLSHLHFDQIRALPPLAHPNILGGGSNYRQHVIEVMTHGPYSKLRRQEGESDEDAWNRNAAFVDHRAKHGMPAFWCGSHSSLCGAQDDIVLPAIGKNHDWELELVLVLGKGMRFASLDEARSMIAGYMMINDLGTLDQLQRSDIPWQFDMTIKSQPTFKVCGPFIVPAAFVERDSIQIKLEVNGVVKHDWPVRDMIFSPEKMVAYASERFRLTPGDIILTGSPPGNASISGDFLKNGDVVTSSLTGLGRQRNRCAAEQIEDGRIPVFGTYR
jgi:2,4-didehydro-3-deoxy-L-rhamnonate hydrolase